MSWAIFNSENGHQVSLTFSTRAKKLVREFGVLRRWSGDKYKLVEFSEKGKRNERD